MSPEEIKRRATEISEEVMRRWEARVGTQECSMAREAAELALSNWTPPPKVSPRVLAAREWFKADNADYPNARKRDQEVDQGEWDNCVSVQTFLAGVAWAEKQAEPVLAWVQAERENYYQANFGRAEEVLEAYRKAMGTEQCA